MLRDDGIGVFLNNAVFHADAFQVFGQNVLGEIGLFLVEVDREDLEIDGGTLLYVEQQIEHRVAVLTA